MNKEIEEVVEETTHSTTNETTEAVTVNITTSSGAAWFSGPCKRCDKKISAEIDKDGKVKCTACGAVF